MADANYERWSELTTKLRELRGLTDDELLELNDLLAEEMEELVGESQWCAEDVERVASDIQFVERAIGSRRIKRE